MQVIRQLTNQREWPDGCVIALGSFDGFHRGHQAVVGAAGCIADDMDKPLAVMTTEPHPRSFFSPQSDNFRLTPRSSRNNLLTTFGVELLFELPFDEQLSLTPAETFVEDILVAKIGVSHVVIGYDYRFGHKRVGDADFLREAGNRYGFGVTVVEPVSVGVEGAAGEIYSSTIIREALKNGEPRKAAALLGHWWTICGNVQKGDQRGRTIGFPTANIELSDTIVPRLGVYAVRLSIGDDQSNIYEGVANIGVRPTYAIQEPKMEVFIFDFDQDIYGEKLNVECVGFIRAEKKFDGLESLKSQINHDSMVAKQILSDPENERSRCLLAPRKR